jgi:hypothetical protein
LALCSSDAGSVASPGVNGLLVVSSMAEPLA